MIIKDKINKQIKNYNQLWEMLNIVYKYGLLLKYQLLLQQLHGKFIALNNILIERKLLYDFSF